MDLADVLRRRRMIRRYDPDRPVPEEVVSGLLAAALRVPSAGNTRGTSLLLLSDRSDVDAYWEVTAPAGREDRWLAGMRTAPLLVLVWTSRAAYLERYARPDKGWLDRDPERWSAPYWFVDAGMSSMSALLSVTDAGLGACFFGVPIDRIPAVRARFGVPEDQLSVGVISVGYPDPAAPVRGKARATGDRPPSESTVATGLAEPLPDERGAAANLARVAKTVTIP